MGIDILPAELPISSSEFFSKALYPFVKELVESEPNVSLEQLSPLLRGATMTDKGRLTKDYEGLKKHLPKSVSHGTQKKTVLLLGSGMVAAPLVEHLMNRPDVKIVVGKIYI